MKTLRELILTAQAGDQESVCELIRTYEPLIEKYSVLFGKRDEDLKGELLVAFIKCIKNFQLHADSLTAHSLREHEINRSSDYPHTAENL